MFVLDTNVVSELRKVASGRADRGLVAWSSATPASAMFISAITLLELELGVLGIERRDAPAGAVLREWLVDRVLPAFHGRILSVDTAVALRCAALHIPNPRSERDAFVAATALVHGMTVVTRNVRDFEPTGVELLNPWDVER